MLDVVTTTLLVSANILLNNAKILHRPRDFRCSNMVVFGDSLSDDGIEASGESHGFARNSNGRVWSEYLTEMLQCEKYVNYAYSGAKSGMDNFYFDGWSGVEWQVEKYLENCPFLNEEPLVILQSGGSIDFFTGKKYADEVVENIHRVITNISEAMETGTLIILTLLDLGSSPGVRAAEENKELQKRLGELVTETNRQLSHIVLDSNLGARRLHPTLRMRLIDINPIVMTAMYHLNTTEPFTHHSADTKPHSAYNYAYHDLWNPSTFVHYAIAKEIVRQLQDL
uniref:Lipase_GDSL domain-containing protein n=1 Tax=Heterorhabditis bacteriophora TaxID=37862 RepID=A0A1I7X9P2_HETBA